LMRRAVTDLKLPMIAPNEPGTTPCGRGEALPDVFPLDRVGSSPQVI